MPRDDGNTTSDDADLLRQAQLAHRHAKDAYDEADRKAAPVLAAAQQLWDAQLEADFGPDSRLQGDDSED
ncbi:MAG: hypothetical protein WC683_14880 [bacterium]